MFYRDVSGAHFCTASVVASPHRDLLLTAAHCVSGSGSRGVRTDIVFAPGYRSGATPYGVRQPKTIVVDPRWTVGADPDLDVAFVVLQPHNGSSIGDVLGANQLAVNTGVRNRVRVTGYPGDASTPITCAARTSAQSATQMRFACTGYASGTSGSPWLTKFDPRSRTGTVVGVIGGYQQGGESPDVSYSPYFGDDIEHLYQQAEAES